MSEGLDPGQEAEAKKIYADHRLAAKNIDFANKNIERSESNYEPLASSVDGAQKLRELIELPHINSGIDQVEAGRILGEYEALAKQVESLIAADASHHENTWLKLAENDLNASDTAGHAHLLKHYEGYVETAKQVAQADGKTINLEGIE